MSQPSDIKKTSGAAKGTNKGAKMAVRKWQEDGDREDQDYYHVPGGDKPDREDLRSAAGKHKKA